MNNPIVNQKLTADLAEITQQTISGPGAAQLDVNSGSDYTITGTVKKIQ